jgi:hypothetical protein
MMSRENYSYKKYQKELARKKKNEEKKQNKLNKNIQAKANRALLDGTGAVSAADSGPVVISQGV